MSLSKKSCGHISSPTQITEPPSWWVLGAGAMGIAMAAQLCDEGQKVGLVLRNQHSLSSYQQQNAISYYQANNKQYYPLSACCLETLPKKIDRIIIACKAYDVIQALQVIQPKLHDKSVVLLIQNGLGFQQEVANLTLPGDLIQAVLKFGVQLVRPFHAKYQGGSEINLGPWPNRQSIHSKNEIISLLNQAPRQARWFDDLTPIVWEKAILNCAINPVGTLHNCRNGELLNHPTAISMMQEVITECHLIAQHEGIIINEDLELRLTALLKNTANNYCSMWQDRHNQKRTEIDYLNGYILRKAQHYGIATPMNAKLYAKLKKESQDATIN